MSRAGEPVNGAVRGRARDPSRDRVQAAGARGRRRSTPTPTTGVAADPRGAARRCSRSCCGARPARRRAPPAKSTSSRATCARALDAGDDAIVVGVDKRYAQLVSDRVWWYDANKDARYTPEIVQKRFGVPPAQVAEWLALVGDDGRAARREGHRREGRDDAARDPRLARCARSRARRHRGPARQRAARRRATTSPRELARARSIRRGRCRSRSTRARLHAARRAATLNALLRSARVRRAARRRRRRRCASTVCEPRTTSRCARALGAAPIALHALLEDPAPVRATLAGLALATATATRATCRAASAGVARARDVARRRRRAEARPRPRRRHRRAAPRGRHARGDRRRLGVRLAPHAAEQLGAARSAARREARARPRAARRGRGARRRPAAQGVERAAGRARRRVSRASAPMRRAAIWHALAPTLDADAARRVPRARRHAACAWSSRGLIVDPAELDRAEAGVRRDRGGAARRRSKRSPGHSFNINSSQAARRRALRGAEAADRRATRRPAGARRSRRSSGSSTRIRSCRSCSAGALLRRLRDNWVDRAAQLHRRRRPRPLAVPPRALVLRPADQHEPRPRRACPAARPRWRGSAARSSRRRASC